MSKIFITYRRADSAASCGRIYDRLSAHFGKDAIFKDVDSIPIGVNFRSRIAEMIQQCAVQLVIIGPSWLDIPDDQGGRRLDDPDDLVRIEVEAGLQRGIPVIPVLVQDATMPLASRLPSSLQPLINQNGVVVRYDPDFDGDVRRMIRALEGWLKPEATPVAELVPVVPTVSAPFTSISPASAPATSPGYPLPSSSDYVPPPYPAPTGGYPPPPAPLPYASSPYPATSGYPPPPASLPYPAASPYYGYYMPAPAPSALARSRRLTLRSWNYVIWFLLLGVASLDVIGIRLHAYFGLTLSIALVMIGVLGLAVGRKQLGAGGLARRIDVAVGIACILMGLLVTLVDLHVISIGVVPSFLQPATRYLFFGPAMLCVGTTSILYSRWNADFAQRRQWWYVSYLVCFALLATVIFLRIAYDSPGIVLAIEVIYFMTGIIGLLIGQQAQFRDHYDRIAGVLVMLISVVGIFFVIPYSPPIFPGFFVGLNMLSFTLSREKVQSKQA